MLTCPKQFLARRRLTAPVPRRTQQRRSESQAHPAGSPPASRRTTETSDVLPRVSNVQNIGDIIHDVSMTSNAKKKDRLT